MRRTMRVLRLTSPTLALAVVLLLAVQLPLTVHAGALVQLSSDPYTNSDSQHKTQVEPDTFSFGSTIVSAFQSGRFFDGGASNIGWATSINGGKAWTHGFLPATTVNSTPTGPYARVSDPSVAFDAKHQIWMISFLGITVPESAPVDVLVSRSTDGGLTWSVPVVINKSGDFNDKNWTVCDTWVSSPFFGNCYTEFDDASRNNLVQMSTSTDGGLIWGAAQSTPDNACVIGGQPLVQPTGTVIVPIDDCFQVTLYSFTSANGGKSWSRVTLAAQILSTLDPGGIRSGPLPSAEMDRLGRVFVVWSDCRFEPGCSSNDLVMIVSWDGKHWTLPKRIPIDPVGSNVDHFIPGLAVDRSTALGSTRLGLTYYYFPNANCTVSTCQLNVGFVSSTNGGASWSAPAHIAGPMALAWLPNTTLGRMVGDYISTSLAVHEDVVAPVFAVAQPPTVGTDCSTTGAVCDEATFTIPAVNLMVGGPNTVSNEPTYALPQHAAYIRHTAN